VYDHPRGLAVVVLLDLGDGVYPGLSHVWRCECGRLYIYIFFIYKDHANKAIKAAK